GAGGWGIGGGCDGRAREYRAQSWYEEGAQAGDSRWRTANRGASVRFDPVDLYCVCADVLSDRSGAIFVRAYGRSGCVCDAGFLSALPDAGADYGHVSVEGA